MNIGELQSGQCRNRDRRRGIDGRLRIRDRSRDGGITDSELPIAHQGVTGVGIQPQQAERPATNLSHHARSADDVLEVVIVASAETQLGVVSDASRSRAQHADLAGVFDLEHALVDGPNATKGIVPFKDQCPLPSLTQNGGASRRTAAVQEATHHQRSTQRDLDGRIGSRDRQIIDVAQRDRRGSGWGGNQSTTVQGDVDRLTRSPKGILAVDDQSPLVDANPTGEGVYAVEPDITRGTGDPVNRQQPGSADGSVDFED